MILGALRRSEKLSVEDRHISIDQGSYIPLAQASYRWSKGDSRDKATEFIDVLVVRATELLNDRFKEYSRLFFDLKEDFDAVAHFESMLKTTQEMDSIKAAMLAASHGISVLSATYNDKTLTTKLSMASTKLVQAASNTDTLRVRLLSGIVTDVEDALPADVIEEPSAAAPKKKQEDFSGTRPMWCPQSPIRGEVPPVQLSMGSSSVLTGGKE